MSVSTLPLLIGLRYNRSSNRQRFLSLLSWFSLLGIILGVAALIIVLSVMNGFQAELRDRMLALVSHGQIERVHEEPIADWQRIADQLLENKSIVAVAPLVGGDVMLSSGSVVRAAELQGIDLVKESSISRIQEAIVEGELQDFSEVRFPIVLGRVLANALGVSVGDRVAVTLPQILITPLGPRPRIKQFMVIALFEVGGEMDANYAYIPLSVAQKFYGVGKKIHALRYLTQDVLAVAKTTPVLQKHVDALNHDLVVVPWTQKRQQLFSAVKMEKIMITFMLSMVIAVAAFNLISVLSMMVAEKRNEIAVLRMMGLSRASVLGIFLTQGISLSLSGLMIGGVIGIVVALNLSDLIHFFEQAFGFYVFDPNVFYVTGLPSVLMWQDVFYVFGLSIVLSVLFIAYPAYRATQIQAVEALQYQ